MNGPHSQRGVALITAMLVVALLAIFSANVSWNNYLEVRRTMNVLFYDEGTQAAIGAEAWVLSLLRDDAQDSDTDHFGELWAQELPILPIESDSIQGQLQGSLQDLQGRFNVNNLVARNGRIDEDALEQFRRLLAALELDLRFADLAADWIDIDQEPELAGAEDAIYSGMVPPYRSANQSLTNVTELAALDGMDRATLNRLLPHVIALPGRTEVNVNTATGPVLQSLHPDITPSVAESLIAEREETGFGNVETSFAPYMGQEDARDLQETSDFFQLKVIVQIDTVRITYYSVLHRDGQRGTVIPILRSFGTT